MDKSICESYKRISFSKRHIAVNTPFPYNPPSNTLKCLIYFLTTFYSGSGVLFFSL